MAEGTGYTEQRRNGDSLFEKYSQLLRFSVLIRWLRLLRSLVRFRQRCTVDDEDLDRSFLRIELEPELFLQCRQERWTV